MKKILAVEDDAETAAYYRGLFIAAGYDVLTAGSLSAGREQYLSFKPDLVILDVGFPFGPLDQLYSVARLILSGGKPVIFVTGCPEKVDRIRLACPKVRLFSKPVPADTLLACVSDLLSPPTGEEE